MISLDEEYIGTDGATIIVRALKVCGGLLCNLSNGNLLGAHFSSSVTPEEILTGCTYLFNHFAAGATVTEMYFIANLDEWQTRGDKYANTHVLAAELKLMFRYTGALKVGDKNIIGPSVDLRFDAGTPALISNRTTLVGDNLVDTPNNNVKYIKVASVLGVRTATPFIVNTTVPHWHRLPATTTGFVPFNTGMFIPL